MIVQCSYCGADAELMSGDVNRARKLGRKVYCNRKCAGMAHRGEPKTPDQKKTEKKAYDAAYRVREDIRLKKKKFAHDWYQANRDPEKEREIRKAKMPLHVEYCRRPEYRAKKHEYDIRATGEKNYGEFAESWRILIELENEIRRLEPSFYERRKARGYYDDETRKRDRNERRRKEQSTIPERNQPEGFTVGHAPEGEGRRDDSRKRRRSRGSGP